MSHLKLKIVTTTLLTVVLAVGLLAALTASGVLPTSTVTPTPLFDVFQNTPDGVQIIGIDAENLESLPLPFITGSPPPMPTATATPAAKTPVPPILPHQPRPTSTGPLSGELETFTWWLLSGNPVQIPVYEAILAGYQALYPNVDVFDGTQMQAGGTSVRAHLTRRILAGNPPDVFQTHGGQELIGTWVVADWIEDLSFLYAAEGWYDVYPQGLLDLLSYNGGIWSVPAAVWRTNLIWYNPTRLSEWGLSVPVTWNEFLTACPTLKKAGVTPLLVGDTWTVNHLWENVALSVLGADGWNAVWRGEKAWTDPEIIAAWVLFDDILDCTNLADVTPNSDMAWQEMMDQVMAGQAAFLVQGDWVARHLIADRGLQPGVDFGWSPAPGTDGLFLVATDAFTLPWDAKNHDNALAWLKLIGSREGQDILNPLLGSSAPRLDSDLSVYDAYHQSAGIDWQTNRIVGSMEHGMVANERFVKEFGEVMRLFTHGRDVSFTVNALQTLCIQCCLCP
jgi:glucose/mannose transport system substrate-binding protein